MMLLLQGVLAPEDVARILRDLDAAPWVDGKTTAGPTARDVKKNRQAVGSDEGVQALEKFVLDALHRHPLFVTAARPKRISRLLFSSYEGGETYGFHTDDALMGATLLRSDLAFTLFLSDPATYEGGALTVATPLGDQAIKLAAGDMVLYAAGSIHAVSPVTSGRRMACVGWIQSVVRDPAQRELLFDLANARAMFARGEVNRDSLLLMDRAQSNLLRMWADT
ncbi:MAG: Fe2+-dependent dioxygenase [Alphaproteobacteria bacterium]|nr:Fe2+-dependent dioxygenase [Alphaproteobacteria bacterium]